MTTPTVLLVDNDPAVRASLRFSLELDGFVVETYEGSEALLKEPAMPSIGCLVIDFRLPTLDGLSLLALLRERGVGLPAIILTSNPTRSLRSRVADADALLVEKPLLSDGLTRALAASMQPRTKAVSVGRSSETTMTYHAITDEALAALIGEFYARVRRDPLLGPVFNGAVDDWPAHLAKLEAFWSSVMLTSGRYKGQPLAVHIRQGDAVRPHTFARWLELWRETTEDVFDPASAGALQDKAARIAESLMMGIAFQRDCHVIPSPSPLTAAI